MKLGAGLLSFLALQACGGERRLPAPPALRSPVVHVVSSPEAPEIRVDTPVTSWLAGIPAGAWDVARTMFEVGERDNSQAAATVALLAPLGAVVGAFYGPFAVRDEETVREGEQLLRGVLLRERMPLATRIAALMQDQAPRLVFREGEGTTLYVGAPSLDLRGSFSLDPKLELTVGVSVSIPSAGYEAEIRYTGRVHSFSQWVTRSLNLHEEIEQALGALAEKVAEEVFLICLPPEE